MDLEMLILGAEIIPAAYIVLNLTTYVGSYIAYEESGRDKVTCDLAIENIMKEIEEACHKDNPSLKNKIWGAYELFSAYSGYYAFRKTIL